MREAIYQAFHLDEAPFAGLLEQADDATRKLQRLYPLSDDETLAMKSYEEAFLVRFTYNSAAIEGSTLSLVDTALVIGAGPTGICTLLSAALKKPAKIIVCEKDESRRALAKRVCPMAETVSPEQVEEYIKKTYSFIVVY